MKYFTRLTMEQEETKQVEEQVVEEPTEVPSYDDLLKDWRL